MSSSRTASESKADHIARMGEGLGGVYDALWQEVAWIHSKWAEYVTLFGASPARIELMNQSAPSFFRTVQDSLWEGVLLHIARLTDPPKSKGKSNLSLRR
jgi:AbiU2